MATPMKRSCTSLLKFFCFKRSNVATHSLLLKRFSSQNASKYQWTETSDGSMIICYHPAPEFPYEHTKPIIRQDPIKSKTVDCVESILKNKLEFDHYGMEKRGPSISDLSKIFYTTKHRWYPLGIRRRNLKKPNPPRDRDYL